MNEIVEYNAIEDDSLIAIAKQAEARIDAVVKIKQMALKVTNTRDWTDQQGNPYLQVSGAEKIANLFNVSWGFLTPEPLYEEDSEGHYTYTYQGRFSKGSRTIEVEGSRSSKDKFFIQYDYLGKDRKEKDVSNRDNKRDVKMAALTNLLGNGITRLLGIRNLTWEDLEKYATVKRADVSKVKYEDRGKGNPPKPPLQEPQSTKTDKTSATMGEDALELTPEQCHEVARVLKTSLSTVKSMGHYKNWENKHKAEINEIKRVEPEVYADLLGEIEPKVATLAV